MIELEKLQNSDIKRETVGTPRTDEMLWRASDDDDFERGIALRRKLERENENLRKLCRKFDSENKNLRKLLDKASQAIACFVELRGMAATELKSAHNGICIFLDATRMLDAIKAEVGEGD